jgi:hydroxymethylbilane synthase
MPHLRIGSRGSKLALWQSNHIADLLRGQGHTVDITVIQTTGDKITDVALAKVGTKGMFTKEIEDALAAGQVDLAVHSLKDLPTELPPGFRIAAVPKRENPLDAFLSARFSSVEDLPQGARVGTSSLRRQAQLLALRPDLEIHPLRGNVDTRVRKLGLTKYVRQILPAGLMCPAAGQGALGIETRQEDPFTAQQLAFLSDSSAYSTTTCERALLNSMGGGCQVPIGAFAEVGEGGILHLQAVVAHPNGGRVLREAQSGSDPLELGAAVGRVLLERGGAAILKDVYNGSH